MEPPLMQQSKVYINHDDGARISAHSQTSPVQKTAALRNKPPSFFLLFFPFGGSLKIWEQVFFDRIKHLGFLLCIMEDTKVALPWYSPLSYGPKMAAVKQPLDIVWRMNTTVTLGGGGYNPFWFTKTLFFFPVSQKDQSCPSKEKPSCCCLQTAYKRIHSILVLFSS